jgi:glycosyltransferase involved in cell wall biosynthesis
LSAPILALQPLRVLTLTYPLAPLSAAACGGCEQIAYQLVSGAGPGIELQRLPAAGWLPAHMSLLSDEEREARERAANERALAWLEEHPVDLIHVQGAPFFAVADRVSTPVLFTLHLARRLYPQGFLDCRPRHLHLQCVSETQRREYPDQPICAVVPNGVDLGRFQARQQPGQADAPLLFLGRICPEKAPHLAIRLARAVKRRLHLVGEPGPFPYHVEYYRKEIASQLDDQIRHFPPPALGGKLAFLRQAAAVVIPSQVEETSSLVAMEAAASGVPALGLSRGALPEVVAHGHTGFLADTWQNLAEYVSRLASIAPQACRAHAEANFDGARMVASYRSLYRRLTGRLAAHAG